MKIFNYNNNMLQKRNYLYEGLNIDMSRSKNIISFVGAGGKTTLIYNLAEELRSLGRKVIITTTTNMFICEKYFLFSNDIAEIKQILDERGIIVLGTPSGDNKFKSLISPGYDELIEICDFMLIESDGSRRLPLKAPAEYEPVIIDKTNLVVGVAGIDAVGSTIRDICHRPEIVCRILNTDESHIITEKDIALLLSSENGQMKGLKYLKGNVRYTSVINKCDNDELLQKAICAARIIEKKSIHAVITNFK